MSTPNRDRSSSLTPPGLSLGPGLALGQRRLSTISMMGAAHQLTSTSLGHSLSLGHGHGHFGLGGLGGSTSSPSTSSPSSSFGGPRSSPGAAEIAAAAAARSAAAAASRKARTRRSSTSSNASTSAAATRRHRSQSVSSSGSALSPLLAPIAPLSPTGSATMDEGMMMMMMEEDDEDDEDGQGEKHDEQEEHKEHEEEQDSDQQTDRGRAASKGKQKHKRKRTASTSSTTSATSAASSATATPRTRAAKKPRKSARKLAADVPKLPEHDLSDANVRNSLPVSFFCDVSSFTSSSAASSPLSSPANSPRPSGGGGVVYGAMTAAGARALEHEKLYQSIRQKRRLRERQRASRLAGAPNERERHRIRREWNEAEVAIREQERQELAGVRAVNGSGAAAAAAGAMTSRSAASAGRQDEEEEEEEVMRASDEDDDVDQERMLPSDDDDDPDDPSSHSASGAMGPSIQFIDGKAVLTRPSALIVRAGARGGRGTPQPTHVVEESAAHGRYYNQATHTRGGANRSGARWRADELELFYEGLRKFGTNFEAIAMTIPGKTRVNVRNKYHSEAKRDADKIDEALGQFAPASLEEYSDATGMSTEEITQPVPKDVLEAAERAVRGETSGEEVLAATAAAQAAGVLLAAAAATAAAAGGQGAGEDDEGEGEGGDVMAMSDDEDEEGAAAMQMSDDDDEDAGQASEAAAAMQMSDEEDDEGHSHGGHVLTPPATADPAGAAELDLDETLMTMLASDDEDE